MRGGCDELQGYLLGRPVPFAERIIKVDAATTGKMLSVTASGARRSAEVNDVVAMASRY